MHPVRTCRALYLVTRLIPALALASCVYQPVIMSNYDQASNYAEMLGGIAGDRELQRAIDQNIVRVMRSGERVPDWRESGVDLDQVLEAAPGGQAGNVILGERADVIYASSKRGFDRELGPGYTTYPVFGTDAMFASAQADQVFDLVRVGPGVWLETVKRVEKAGNASCSSTGVSAARLHSKRSFASLSKLEKSALAAYVAAARRGDATICSVAEAVEGNRCRFRVFTPDGQRLPVFDSQAPRVRIAPRAEVARLMAQ